MKKFPFFIPLMPACADKLSVCVCVCVCVGVSMLLVCV